MAQADPQAADAGEGQEGHQADQDDDVTELVSNVGYRDHDDLLWVVTRVQVLGVVDVGYGFQREGPPWRRPFSGSWEACAGEAKTGPQAHLDHSTRRG
jgi:hypothetical protein